LPIVIFSVGKAVKNMAFEEDLGASVRQITATGGFHGQDGPDLGHKDA
jgi:hypothetical protein